MTWAFPTPPACRFIFIQNFVVRDTDASARGMTGFAALSPSVRLMFAM
jgi:hypothetical protein